MVSTRQLIYTALVCASYAACIWVDDWQTYNDTYRYGIQYGPGWSQEGFQDPVSSCYKGTYTSTHTTGSYAMFSFRGTGISYNAIKAPDSGIVMLAIDGQQVPALNPNSSVTSHMQTIFETSGLAPGDHQIVFGTQPGYVRNTGVVGLDYFGVTLLDDNPSFVPRDLGPGAWSVPSDALIVDDGDASITYSDEWKRYDANTVGPTPLFFNRTQHTSQVPGSSLKFTFRGTGVWYFSDDFPQNSHVLISIDESEKELVKTSTGVTWVSQRMTWSRAGLSDGKHVLTITHAGQRSQYANVDFFMYLPSPSVHEYTSGNSFPVGEIAGGVAGGIVGLVVILVGLLFAYKRYRLGVRDGARYIVEAKDGVHHVTLVKTATQDDEAMNDEGKIPDKVGTV